MADAGFRPPRPTHFRLPGRSGAATVDMMLYDMQVNNQISEHDRHIGQKLAHVITGGDVSAFTPVTEQHLLDLEREAFLSLCGEEKTQERIAAHAGDRQAAAELERSRRTTTMASRVVIASAVRTPFTRALKGEFKDTRPDTLAAVAIRAAVAARPRAQALGRRGRGARLRDARGRAGHERRPHGRAPRRAAGHRAGDDHQPLLQLGRAVHRPGGPVDRRRDVRRGGRRRHRVDDAWSRWAGTRSRPTRSSWRSTRRSTPPWAPPRRTWPGASRSPARTRTRSPTRASGGRPRRARRATSRRRSSR